MIDEEKYSRGIDTDAPRRELQSAFQRALDNLFNRVHELEVVDIAREAEIERWVSKVNALEKRIDALDAAVPLATGFEDDKERQYFTRNLNLKNADIENCTIDELVAASCYEGIFTDEQVVAELQRRLDEAAKPTKRQQVAASSEGEPQ